METKPALRERLLAARARRSVADLDVAAAALAEHGGTAWSGSDVVAAYAGVGHEPPTRLLLDRLATAGVEVLLPVVSGLDLEWAAYSGWERLATAPRGLLEPRGPRLGAQALRAAHVVVVPALAVDGHGGRLGRGSGYYDRALAGRDPAGIVAVVFADEVLERLPVEAHDVRVGAALTPDGFTALGAQ